MYHWHKLFDDFNLVTPPPSPLHGRPHIIGLTIITAVRQLYKQHSDTYLDELQWYLMVQHDTGILISSLQRNLGKAGLTQKMLHKIVIEQDEQLWVNFQATIHDLEHFSGTGMEFVTVNKLSKDEQTYACWHGCATIDHSADISDVFVWVEFYSLVAAMLIQGYLMTHIMEGSFNMQSFFSFIIDDLMSLFLLLPWCMHTDMHKVPLMNHYPEKHSVLVLDNCRIHHTDILYKILNDCGK